MFGSFCKVFAVTAALLAHICCFESAHADNAISSLTQASKLLDQGQPAKAIEKINETLKSGSISSDIAAKALLMRGQAQEKIAKYAYALADYNQALWMQGLSSADKGKAEQGRDRILAKLGVASDSDKVAEAASQPPRAATGGGQKRNVSRNDVSESWGAEVQTTPSEERTGGFGSIFNGIFGSPDKPASPEPVKASAEPLKARIEAAPPKAVPQASTLPAPRIAQAVQTAKLANDASSDSARQVGDFAVQFAALLTEDTAVYEADRIARRYGEWLGGRTPSIMIRPTSEGGTLYKVVVEPFERGEGIAICELLKTKGVSCMLISR